MPHIRHLSKSDLLLAADGARTPPRAEVAAHLTECVACRSRLAALTHLEQILDEEREQTIAEAATGRHQGARVRLEAALAEPESVGWRGASAGWLANSWMVPAVGMLALLLVTVWREQSPSPSWPSISTFEQGALPDARLTPGAVSAVPLSELCDHRPADPPPVPASVRARVLRNYGMTGVPDSEYELDYLITADLGGATEARNLWPERYGSRVWNAHVKDQLEFLLPRLVCSRAIDLAVAQQDIARDWIAAYKKYFGTDRPFDQWSVAPAGANTPFLIVSPRLLLAQTRFNRGRS